MRWRHSVGSGRVVRFLGLAILGGLLLLAGGGNSRAGGAERYLYVWAGDQARKSPDFLAVVNFHEKSPDYGKIITTVPLPNPGDAGNEPHHVGLSEDGKILATGGLLSVLKGQKEVFFFDVSDPASPRFLGSEDPPYSAITDEFLPLPGGGFLVTMMGDAQGHSPGKIAEFDKDLKLVAEHPPVAPDEGFNPHGISARPEINLMLTSDFICPSTTLHSVPGSPLFRGSVRVWDFRTRKIVRSIPIPAAGGTIDVRLIPRDKKRRGFTAGMSDEKLYLLDTQEGTARSVFDFATIAPGGWPQLIRITKDGKFLFITMNKAGKVAMLDIVNPELPRLVDVLDLGGESGPHYLALTADERRLVVTDYFLNEDDLGKVKAEGDHKVHVAKVSKKGLKLDPRFNLDFNTAIGSGPARPHGVAMK